MEIKKRIDHEILREAYITRRQWRTIKSSWFNRKEQNHNVSRQ